MPDITDERHLTQLFLSGRPATTRRAYEKDLGLFFEHLGRPLVQLTYEDLATFTGSLTGANTTRARRAATVRSFLRFGHRLGLLPQVLFPPTPRSQSRLHERILDEAEVHAVIAELPAGRDRCLARLLYLGGLRISEALDLRWHDVGKRWVTVTGKGTRTRTVLLPDRLIEDLGSLRSGADPGIHVFRNSRGRRLSASYVRRIVRRAGLEALDKPVSPHWLRHCHASHALDHGAPIHLVAHDLGHASVSTTTAYLHVRPDQGSSLYLATGV